MFFKIFVAAAIFQVVTGKTRIDPLVNTDVGLIKGLQANDGGYSMFLGIPYGKVDEENPFSAATPYPNFENTFEAFSDTIVCPQVEEFNNTIVGTPDCLVLNVYVPSSASSTNRLPVLVWIYGGGFMYGDGNRYLYDPGFLVKQNIIVVAINYRLGPYGFMCLDTPEVPGNQGLKDQVLGLRWVNRNIESFGGDVNRITISGESAGSISVALHLHSNSEKLHHQAILQSGTEKLSLVTRSSITTPIDIAEYLGFSTDSVDDAVSYLAKVDSHKIIAAVNELNLIFRPSVEKEFDGVESFITQHWITADLPKIKNMPILIGFNSDESFWTYASLEDEYYENFNLRDNLALEFNVDVNEFEGMEETVRHFYFGDEPMSAKVKRNVIDFNSDFLFISPTYRSISKYLDYGVGNIFFYLFSYSGGRNYFRDYFNYTGATHSDELGYIFDISYMKNRPMAPEDEIVVDRMTTMWANFVKFGDPTPQTSDLLQIKWTPIKNMSQMPCLNIDSQLSLGSRPFNRRATFWDLFYRTNESSLKVHNPSET